MKIGMTLGNTIGLMLLGATGFVSGGGFEVTPQWISSYMRVTFLFPAIIFFASAIIMLICYKITDADAAKYAKENMEKIKQQAASMQNTQE